MFLRHNWLVSSVMLTTMVCSSAAFAGAGTSYTYRSTQITATGNTWQNIRLNAASDGSSTGLTNGVSPLSSPGVWVTARISATLGPAGTLGTNTGFALASVAAPANTSSTPSFPAGSSGLYYVNTATTLAASAPATSATLASQVFNTKLSTGYSGGTDSLVFSVRNSAANVTFSNLSVTLFQEATPDFEGLISGTDKDGTFIRPNTFTGLGSPTLSSSTVNSNYKAIPFTVSQSGAYLISMISSATGGSGGLYGLLYEGSFNPASPTTNLVRSQNTTYGSASQPSVGGVVLGTYTSSGANFTTSSVPGIQLDATKNYIYVVAGNGTLSATGGYKVFLEGSGFAAVPGPGTISVGIIGAVLGFGRRNRAK